MVLIEKPFLFKKRYAHNIFALYALLISGGNSLWASIISSCALIAISISLYFFINWIKLFSISAIYGFLLSPDRFFFTFLLLVFFNSSIFLIHTLMVFLSITYFLDVA